MGLGPYELTASEHVAVLGADRAAVAYLVFRTGDGQLVLHPLEDEVATIGRAPDRDVVLAWDGEVSRAHARLECHGGRWSIIDDGLSRNGTFVGPDRVAGRRALEAGDTVRVGRTTLVLRAPAGRVPETITSRYASEIVEVTAAERRVLVALCRPFAAVDGGPSTPATNAEIASELVLTVPGVKTHMRSLFVKLAVGDLPQNRKRAELARRALSTGVVRPVDLRPPPGGG